MKTPEKRIDLQSREGLAERCSAWMFWEGKGKASIAIFLHCGLTDHLGWAWESFICPLKIYKIICWQHHHHLESIICPKRKNKVNCCLKFLTGIQVMRTMSSPHGPEFPKSLSTLTSCLRLLWWIVYSCYISKIFYYFSCKKKNSKNFSSNLTSPFSFSAKMAFRTCIIVAGKNLTKYITAEFALVVSLCLLTPVFSNWDLYWGLKRENIQNELFLGVTQPLVLFFN